MNTRPIPVPPPGTRLQWHLDQPFRLKHLVIAVLVFALLLITGYRTEMDRMVTMTTEAVGNLVGL
ncbi:MAG: phosphonate ABC transporter, permease protein PhnE, partial [Gammaproteobacteria bacterium HGW-Gammaproteobacteria-6]